MALLAVISTNDAGRLTEDSQILVVINEGGGFRRKTSTVTKNIPFHAGAPVDVNRVWYTLRQMGYAPAVPGVHFIRYPGYMTTEVV